MASDIVGRSMELRTLGEAGNRYEMASHMRLMEKEIERLRESAERDRKAQKLAVAGLPPYFQEDLYTRGGWWMPNPSYRDDHDFDLPLDALDYAAAIAEAYAIAFPASKESER